MAGLKVVLQDKSEVDAQVSLAIDANGIVTVTTQKVVQNDTTGKSEPEGDPITTELSAEVSAACTDALLSILGPLVPSIVDGTYGAAAAPAPEQPA